MTATTLKKRIQKAMNHVDESVLEQVYAILEKAQKKQRSLKPMTMEEFRARIAQSEKDIKERRVYSNEEVKKMFEKRIASKRLSATVKRKIKKSLLDLDAGKVHSNDSVFDELNRWLAKK